MCCQNGECKCKYQNSTDALGILTKAGREFIFKNADVADVCKRILEIINEKQSIEEKTSILLAISMLCGAINIKFQMDSEKKLKDFINTIEIEE